MNASALRRLVREDEGATVVMVAVMFMVIIALLALVVDVGLAYMVDRRLQSAADAAALAACERLIQMPWDPSEADAVARYYLTQHANGVLDGLRVSDVQVNATEYPAQPQVTISASHDVALPFGGVFGRALTRTRATAVARGERLTGVRYAAPYAIVVPGAPQDVRYEIRNRVTRALVASGPLADVGTGRRFTATVSAPEAPAAYDVQVYYRNELGVPEVLYDSRSRLRDVPGAVMFTRGAGQPVEDVTSNGPLWVEWRDANALSASHYWPTVTARVSGVTYAVNAPLTTNADGHILLGSSITAGGQVVAYVRARRNDAPVRQVTVSPIVADPGTPVQIAVEFTGADPTKRETSAWGPMRIRPSGSAEYSGDYVEMDLAGLSHVGCGASPFDATGVSGMARASWIYYGYPAPIHVGDDAGTIAVSGAGLTGFRLRTSNGAYRATLPVVMRTSPTRVRVIGFVPVGFGYSGAATRILCDENYTATPHEFSASPAPAAGSNGVMAARLVRP